MHDGHLGVHVPGSDVEHTCEVSPSAVRFGLRVASASCSILSLHSTVNQNGCPYGFHVTVTSHEKALLVQLETLSIGNRHM